MEQQGVFGRIDRPTRTATIIESDVLDEIIDDISEPSATWNTEWLDRLESVIERYPWPTLLLALGIGYVMARRMRS